MPYVLSSGEVSQKQPWSLSRIIGIFWSILNFFFMFFRTLISPGSHSRGDRYTQDFRGPGGGTKPRHVSGSRDLSAKLKEAGNKLVVIDFFATWCGPCKMIEPDVEAMASNMPNVMFLKVDVDESFDIASEYEVSSMPTFVFIKNGRKVDSFSGASIEKLRSTVYRHQ